MKCRKSPVAVLSIFALLLNFSGCTHGPELKESADPGVYSTWEAPEPDTTLPPPPPPVSSSPLRPAMDWVAAGSFRSSRRTPDEVTAIVIHTTEGRYDMSQAFSANQIRNYESTIRYFQKNNRSVSAHFVLGPGGEICQMVAERDVAHTQTYYNGRAIGIECAGWSGRPETWTPEMMEALVSLTAYLCVEWEIPAFHPPGTAYEGANRVVLKDGSQHFTGQGLIGHFQVQPWNKTDPGPHFPWEEFSERVRERIREFDGHN